MTFNAKEYAWAIAHGKSTMKYERPVTLADHEAAEREARQLIKTRLSDGGCEDATIPEISELDYFEYVEDSICSIRDWAGNIRDWAGNINEEAAGWAEIAEDLRDFKAKQKKAG
jgi:hypothetical protein